MFISYGGPRHGVSHSSQRLPDISLNFHDGNDSANGLQNRSRKWLLAFISSMFALSTMYWIACVVLVFQHIDLMNNCIRACYGRDTDDFCLDRQFLTLAGVAPADLLGMFDCIFLVNVSTVKYRVACAHASLASTPVN